MIDIDIQTYYSKYSSLPIVDVRSPGEFEKGHVPGAHSIPLFTNPERAHVGTVYKQQSKEAAIELGYKYVTPKLQWYVDEALKMAPQKDIVVHCWRGGMRSHSFAKHLEENGFNRVFVIDKGYKSFRNLVLKSFEVEVDLKVIGGYTGSGKTHILEELKQMHCQVVDLEALAHHKGSAFGAIGEKDQPTVEQFENNLFEEWRKLDFKRPVYIEDESHNIGQVKVPMPLHRKIREAVVYFLEVPKEKRAEILVGDYVGVDNGLLKHALLKIEKKLGGAIAKQAFKALEEEDYFQVAMFALIYYDKSYMRGVMRREPQKIKKIELSDSQPDLNASYIKRVIEGISV